MENKIFEKTWVILRPSYNQNGDLINVGIVGTGFFITKNKFITAYHCVKKEVFIPNESYNNTNILIMSPIGDSITIEEKDVKFYTEFDITLININSEFPYLKNKRNIKINDSIYNIGYPSNQIMSLLKTNPLKIKATQVCWGSILNIVNNYSIKSNDVNIENKEVFVLDYTVDVGFSGGPLLSSGKIIGMMSHINPETNTAVAINSKYFYSL